VSGCVYGSVIEVLPRLENTEQKTLYELCTRLVAQAASEEEIFITPILGRLFRTFLQDTDSRHTGHELYSSPDNAVDIAKIFLVMILGSLIGTVEADLELFKPLGFHQEAESFKQFFVCQFLPWFKVDDRTSEHWWASIRISPISYLLGSSVIAAIRDNLTKKRLFRTSKGHIGLGPVCMETGNVVCVLDRCYFPVVLRNIDSHYVYVGGAYVMGLMQGEITTLMLQDKTSLERLEIR
jgi:transposase